MLIAAVGERFGHIINLYDEIKVLENRFNISVDWLLQVGSLGAFPDKSKWTKALKRSYTPDDFQKIYLGQVNINKPTVFISGPHDDHNWLAYKATKGELEIAYNLSFVINGFKTHISQNEEVLSVVGLGKTFSPNVWTHGVRKSKDLAHYTRREVEKACSQGKTDILLCHEPPYNTKFNCKLSTAEGINKVVFATRPRLLLHKSYEKINKIYNYNSDTLAFCLAPYGVIVYDTETNKIFSQK